MLTAGLLPAVLSHALTAPEAGFGIENKATLMYVDPAGTPFTNQRSNKVVAVVQPLEGLALTADTTVAEEAGAAVALAHVLTNTGNTPTVYTFTYSNLTGDDYDFSSLSLWRDADADGNPDAGAPLIPSGGTVTLAAGEAVQYVLQAAVPGGLAPGKTGKARLTAVSQVRALSASNTDTVTTSQPLARLRIQEAVSSTAAVRGQNLDFTIDLLNNGVSAAGGVPLMIDGVPASRVLAGVSIPANTVFVSVLSGGGGTALYHIRGQPAASYQTLPPAGLASVDSLVFAFLSLAGGQGAQMSYRAAVSANASGSITNYSTVEALDPLNTVSNRSNTVESFLAPFVPAIGFFTPGFTSTEAFASHGDPLFVKMDAAACNQDPLAAETRLFTVTSRLAADTETFYGVETGANTGIFELASIPTRSAGQYPQLSNNGMIEVLRNDTVTATLQGCGAASVSASVLIDPGGIVFDSITNAPIPGTTVSLIDVTGAGNGGVPGGPATVFHSDGVTPAPATVVTGSDGYFQFPLVPPSIYRFSVTTPASYLFPSTYTASELPPGRIIDTPGSYGGTFPVGPATTIVEIDVPLDLVPSGLGMFAEKTASKSAAEPGDFVDYKVTLRNTTTGALAGVSLADTLPAGFTYVRGSARLNGAPAPDPAGGGGPALTFPLGTLPYTGSAVFSYRVRVGPAATQGDGVNRAQASNGIAYSNAATAQVKVAAGVFTDRGYIFGKVFVDRDRDGVQGLEEVGVPGVRLWLEDGTFAVTDTEGKYSIYGVSPRTHVVKVDQPTLPQGVWLVETGNRNAGDAGSRFADVRAGELHKADFAVYTCAMGSCRTGALAEIVRRRREGEGYAAAAAGAAPALQLDRNDVLDPRARPAVGVTGGLQAPALEPGAGPGSASPSTAAVTAMELPDAETEIRGLGPEAGFVNLQEGVTLPAPQTAVRVKGPGGAVLSLSVNGKEIPASRVGRRATLESAGIQLLDYIGVDLVPGPNRLELEAKDPFGNRRGGAAITVFAPGSLGRLRLTPQPDEVQADGVSAAKIKVELLDERGLPVTARTQLTLEASLGRWTAADSDPRTPGVQTFAEGGAAQFLLVSPVEPGDCDLRVSAGLLSARTSVTFMPVLRPLVAAGILEGTLNLNSLGKGELGPRRTRDGFEDYLRNFSRSGSDGRWRAAGRTALFMKGRVADSYLLTLGYDSEKEKDTRLFRDIQPDDFYPAYGDSAVRGFDAQSTDRLYARLERGRSWLLYGDFLTDTPGTAMILGRYSRSLSGLKAHLENRRWKVNAWGTKENTTQAVDEIRAGGISGPYQLSRTDLTLNSEKVEILVRDRNQPAVILKTTPQQRFSDYELEQYTGRLLMKSPVPSLDADLNPVYIKVTYEVADAGKTYGIYGADAQARLGDRLDAGVSAARDENPQNPYTLLSANGALKLGAGTSLLGELAQSDRLSLGRGSAWRAELRRDGGAVQGTVRYYSADSAYYNPAAGINPGRAEAALNLSWRAWRQGTLRGEGLLSENRVTGGRRNGQQLSLEQSFNNNLRLEAAVRHSGETSAPATLAALGTTPRDTNSGRLKASAQIPGLPAGSVYGEYEKAFDGSGARMEAVGGEYALAGRGRLYARHEFLNSLSGVYGLNGAQSQNSTVVGLDADYMRDGHVFSEYRARDSFNGRDAEAAVGLRNGWQVSNGVKLNTGFEQVRALSGAGNNESTALTGGAEYTGSERVKGSTRLEWRDAGTATTWLQTGGLAVKMNRDWTALVRDVVGITDNHGAGGVLRWRLQLGLAWRQTEEDRWNGLARYERRYERDESGTVTPFRREVDIVSAHLNYQPRRTLVLGGEYALKTAREDSNGQDSRSTTHLAAARATYDLTERWDLGLTGRALFSGDLRSRRGGTGLETGYLLKCNLWLSAGYNVFGFYDKDLSADDYTDRGGYVRLRLKFDENLFGAAPARDLKKE